MLKKTTVYLEDEDKDLLKKLAATKQMTFSEALRFSIRQACRPANKEEEAFWKTLEKVWARNRDLDPSEVEKEVDKAVNEVRSGKAKRSRRA